MINAVYNYFNPEELQEAKDTLIFLTDKRDNFRKKSIEEVSGQFHYARIIKRLDLQIYSIKYTYGL